MSPTAGVPAAGSETNRAEQAMNMERAGTPYNFLQMQQRGTAYGLNNQEQIMN